MIGSNYQIKIEKLKSHKYLALMALFMLIQLPAYSAFDKVDYGARSLGMGSAYVSVANDASSVFWNTSGIAGIDQKELEMSYILLYDLVSYSSISYAQNIRDGSIGLGVISSTDAEGIYREIELVICYGRSFFDDLNIGLGIKYLSSEASLDEIKLGNGRGFALDVGAQYGLVDDAVNLGLRLRNLIGYVSYNRKAIMDIAGNKYSELPDFSYALGGSVDMDRFFPTVRDTILAIEVADSDLHAGLEYTFRDILSIRTGLRLGNALNRAITGGFGVKASSIRLDFAYVSSSVGVPTSQFSVSVAW